MKVCTIQPPYGFTPELAVRSVEFLVRELDACDDSVDLILTPEYSNAPGTISADDSAAFARKYGPLLEDAAQRAAVRCHAVVALSLAADNGQGLLHNATRIYRPDGTIAGEYWKQQLVLSEHRDHNVDDSYTRVPRTPAVIEAEGICFGFVICYDAYFEEYIESLAYRRPDVVLVSAMQRQEPCENLRLLNRMLAYHTNAFVVRSSYSMGETAETGGTSLIIGPDGKILAEMGEKTGRLIFEIGDVHRKYMRTNSFQGAMIRNDQFIEQGRTPWAYRPAGPFICPDDRKKPFPRVCAHRGFHTTLPENTLPAFGAAVALGADEIEFDLWETADGVPVSIHDPTLERVSNGSGKVTEKTFQELRKLDFSKGCDPSLAGLRITTLEDILRKFARQTIFNIHIKNEAGKPVSRPFMKTVSDQIHQYDCDAYSYFMGTPAVHEAALEVCPHIPRCMGADGDMEKMQIIDWALRYQCSRVQFFKPFFTKEMIDRAHANNLICNCFWSDDPSEAELFRRWGIDTILTNNYLQVSRRLAR